MKRALALLLLAGCSIESPELQPPGFGDGVLATPRLFFPTGMTVAPGGALLVANGNFDRLFSTGTVVSLDPAYIDSIFVNAAARVPPLDCSKPIDPNAIPAAFDPACDPDIPASAFLGKVTIGNYAGPLVLDPAATTAYTGSRDTNQLNAVSVYADGHLSCRGADGQQRCAGIIDLKAAATVEGPYAIVPGFARPPGADSDQQFLYVASLIPRVDSINSGTVYSSSWIAALPLTEPTSVAFTMSASNEIEANGIGIGPMIFDPVRRQLLMSGCYQRFASGTGGDPSSGPCSVLQSNVLRAVDVDATGSGSLHLYDLAADISATTTTDMYEAGGDPGHGIAADTLWATVRNPDALVEINLPASTADTPRVRRVTSLPLSPAGLLRIPRPGAADLIAVVSEKLGALAVYDSGNQQIVAQVERLGDTPYTIRALPSPAGVQRVAVTVFGACSLALVEIPLAAPWQSVLRARMGRCPK